MARPTKYNEEMQAKAEKYLEMPLFETATKEVIARGEIQTITYERPNGIPSIAGLGLYLNVNRDTIYQWAKKYPEFSGTLNNLQQKQAAFLEYHGLTKGYDSAFAKFIAVNTTDYRDKVEQAQTSKIEITIDDKDSEL